MFSTKSVAEVEREQHQQRKLKRIKNAKMDEKHRDQVPGIEFQFQQENFIQFKVVQDADLIRLQTYREKAQKVQSPRALLFLFHGLNSHINHGAMIAKNFSEEGIEVVGFDHRGFGQSEGLRGYLESVEVHLQDSRQWLTMMDNLYSPEIPRFIGGLSMGGMTTYRLSLQYPEQFKGAILFAPAIAKPMSSFIHGMSQFFSLIVPQVQLFSPPKGVISKNPAVGEEIKNNDPHVYKEALRPNTGKTIMDAMVAANETFQRYQCPFIVIQGGCDKLVDPDVADELIARSASTDQQKIYIEDLWHDIWHEKQIYQILPKVIKWTLERIPSNKYNEQVDQEDEEEQQNQNEQQKQLSNQGEYVLEQQEINLK